MNVTEEFTDYLFRCEQNISERDLDMAKNCLLDYLGEALAGSVENGSLLAMADLDPGECPVLGTGKQAGVLTAAFLNGYNAHTLELDDGHRFGAIHLGASVISAVLCAAQNQYARGKCCRTEELLRGIITGYEAAVRCGIAMQPGHKKKGYHTSGTCGTIGAAVGVGFLLGYDRAQMMSTVAGAATSAAGFLEIQENSSDMKPYNLAHAAMSGLAAAMAGSCGLCPPDDILGGPRGVLRVMSDTFSEEKLLSRTDGPEIRRIYVKPYAACRHCHPAMEAALKIRNQYHIPAEKIDRIDIRTYDLAVRGHDHREVCGTQSAKLSMPFGVAAAYITGEGGMEAFSEESLKDSRIRELAAKVSVQSSEEFTALSPGKRVSEVHAVSGTREYSCRVDYAKGEPENPMTTEEIRGKFLGLMKWAGMEKTAEGILSVFDADEMKTEELFSYLQKQ